MSGKPIIDFDKTWSLFLDRDGVINKRPINDYVKKWSDFSFIDGVLEALSICENKFKYIFIVTNQQGIGKNLMTEEDLALIHKNMIAEIQTQGGKVDAVYHCPDLATKPLNCRKPGLFMANRAKEQFSDVNFQKSIMVGDTNSDMQFGKNAGMTTIFVGEDVDIVNKELIDMRFDSLQEFVLNLDAND